MIAVWGLGGLDRQQRVMDSRIQTPLASTSLLASRGLDPRASPYLVGDKRAPTVPAPAAVRVPQERVRPVYRRSDQVLAQLEKEAKAGDAAAELALQKIQQHNNARP